MFGSHFASHSRKKRGISQNLFLIREVYNESKDQIIYDILGTTKNVYSITMNHDLENENVWSCTCPDYSMRKNICKHIYFIQGKPLAGVTDNNWWSKAIERINDPEQAKRKSIEFLASKKIIDEYENKKRKLDGIQELDEGCVVQRPFIDSGCPICFEDMRRGDSFVYCQYSCGNTFHRECFQKWKNRSGDKCPYCCIPILSNTEKGNEEKEGDYINLSKVIV